MPYSDIKLWFSPQGRVNRRPYFFAGLAAGGLIEARKLVPDALLILYLPIILAALYVTIALGIKRCHDRGRSGFFLLLSLIPLLNLWPLIELTFFQGTAGPNDYGPDPLQPEQAAAPPSVV